MKNLNKVEEQLATVTADTPGFLVGGLKERELSFTNSKVLHEHYFANLGGDGKPTSGMQQALSDSFGSYARFEELFRATGMSLAGGSGWTILDYGFSAGDVRIYWAGNHTQSLAFGAPLLVLDMYEHAYAIDYGAAAAQYVDAFFANVQWGRWPRYERAQAAQALKGWASRCSRTSFLHAPPARLLLPPRQPRLRRADRAVGYMQRDLVETRPGSRRDYSGGSRSQLATRSAGRAARDLSRLGSRRHARRNPRGGRVRRAVVHHVLAISALYLRYGGARGCRASSTASVRP